MTTKQKSAHDEALEALTEAMKHLNRADVLMAQAGSPSIKVQVAICELYDGTKALKRALSEMAS